MKRIKIFSSYCTDEQILDNITRGWNIINGVYKDLEFVTDDSYEYAIVFNYAFPGKDLPKKNVIGFSHEPREILKPSPEFCQFALKKIGAYYIDDVSGLPNNFKLGNTFVCPHEYEKSENEIYSHENIMSFQTSTKTMTSGHLYRRKLVDEILKTDMNIHIYSQGLSKIIEDPRVIKDFDYDNWGVYVSMTYEKYKYQIVIENVRNYVWRTEKLSNCIVKETIPLYYGCVNARKKFGDFLFELTGDINKDMEIIKHVYTNKPDTNTKYAKKVFYEDNFLEFVYKHFK